MARLGDAVSKIVQLDDVIAALVAGEFLLQAAPVAPIKPNHGPCCTCQKCGRDHDACVCEHNRLLDLLNSTPEHGPIVEVQP